jgi:hypothetical protein
MKLICKKCQNTSELLQRILLLNALLQIIKYKLCYFYCFLEGRSYLGILFSKKHFKLHQNLLHAVASPHPLFKIIYSTFSLSKMKNKKYHTVGTVLKSNRKTKNTTLSEQFQNLIEKQKIPYCRNSSKIQSENCIKRPNQ